MAEKVKDTVQAIVDGVAKTTVNAGSVAAPNMLKDEGNGSL
jgi:hypothetical protein